MRAMLEGASQRGGNGIATAIGLVTFFLGSTGAFLELQTALNAIWRVKPKPDAGIKDMLLQRLLSFGLVVGVGFVLLVSLLVSAGARARSTATSASWCPRSPRSGNGVNILVSLGVVTLLFAMIYQFLPDVDLRLRHVWVGALVTAGLFTIGKYADRALSRHQRCGVELRRGRVGGGAAGVGVLLGADRAAGRGVHQGVRGALRRTTSARDAPMRRRIRRRRRRGGRRQGSGR